MQSEIRGVNRFFRRHPDAASAPPPNPDLPIGHDTLPNLKHIVILMMENHSYDNYLGMLAGHGDGFPLDAQGHPTAAEVAADGSAVPAHHFSTTTQAHGVPTQSWHASQIQYHNGANDGFVRSIEQTVPKADPTVAMGYWNEADIPFYYGLARTFPLAVRWFGSCLGPTFPNRRFLIAGTANGLIDDLPVGMADYPDTGTIFDVLAQQNISWTNYHSTPVAKHVFKRALGKPVLDAARWIALNTLKWIPPLLHVLQDNLQFTSDLYPMGLARFMCHLDSTEQFFQDAAEGKLPAVTIIDPDFGAYSEENPGDVQHGEGFAAEVINKVMHGKGWPNTVLIWFYDEHGGYYDHVPPPEAVPPDDVMGHSLLDLPGWFKALARPLLRSQIAQLEAIDLGNLAFDRLGFRVPAVVVSPFAKPGYVSDTTYDHTSVLKLIETKWNLPPLTRRDAAAVAPLDMLDLEGPPAFLIPPDLPAAAQPWGTWEPS
ncbi:MAG TPA: alkaline phosphatase family protein [Acidimicrobiales bacterium]|nr:alkaline phosphatase family protein [Acidimicrobiales bacterium]